MVPRNKIVFLFSLVFISLQAFGGRNVDEFRKLKSEEEMFAFFHRDRMNKMSPEEMDLLKPLCENSGFKRVEVFWFYNDFIYSEVLKRSTKEVLESITQMLLLAKKYELPVEECVARFRKTLLDFSAHRLDEKQTYYEYLNTLEEIREIGIEPLKRFGPDWILNELGRNFYEVSDYEKAIESLELSKNYEVEGSIFKLLSLNLLESSYAKLGRLDSAFANAEKIYAISSGKINRINYDLWTQQFWQSLSQLHMADYLLSQGKNKEALPHLEIGFSKIPVCNDFRINYQVLAEYEALNEVARMQMQLGNYSSIDSILERASILLKELKVEMDVHQFKPLMLYRNFVKWFYYKKDYKGAFFYLEKADSIQELLNKRNDKRQLWQTEMRVKSERYKAEIKKIEKERELGVWLRNIALALLFAGLLIGYIIYKRIAKDNKTILEQKSSLEESLSEKETLLKEVHHRVKNNFQIITGLLEKQALKTNDPTAQALFREGQDRIISMALVHQNIYQSENLNSIGLKSYIELLSLQIRQSFNHLEGIQIHTDIDQLQVNIDKAIPIGLMLNECITNCFKHAFKNRNEGTVWITLKTGANDFTLEIRDDGIGLDFQKLDNKTSSIGLSLLQGLCRQIDCKMDFGNNTQKGSFFRFNILR